MSDFLYLNVLILILYIFGKLMSGSISRRLQYSLWLLVPVYLLVCIMNCNILSDLIMANSPMLAHRLIKLEVSVNHGINSVVAFTVEFLTAKGIYIKADAFYILKMIRYGITIALVLGFILYNTVFSIRCIRRRRFYKQDKKTGLKLYLLDYPQTPFLLRRSIYVHPDMTRDEELLKHAICHEYSHYRQGDFVWTLLSFLLLFYYWFDPVVWLAVKHIRQDSELSCDERVISILGEDSRVAYGASLIKLIKADKNKTKCNIMSTMGGSKKQLKERVEAIAKPEKHSIVGICVIVLCVVGAACYMWIGSQKNLEKSETGSVFIWDGTKVEREEIARVTLYRFVEDVTYPETDITQEVLAGNAVVLAPPGRYMVIVSTKDNKRIEISDCSTDETAYRKGLLPSNVIDIGGDNK